MARLSVTFFVDDSCTQPEKLRASVNTELIDFVWQKCREAGYEDLDALVKAWAQAFGFKNTDKLRRNLREFGLTAELNHNYLAQMLRLLSIDKAELEALRTRHWDKLYEEEKLFIANFELLLRNADTILQDSRYRNIVFRGLYLATLWVGRNRPLTLGELYYHYNKSEWIFPACCGSVYLYRGSGSPLSGSNRYEGFCLVCKKIFRGSRESSCEIIEPFLKNPPDFPYQATEFSIKQLLADLNGDHGVSG
jgi:hypothetical protein